jgi:hypothetical protein
MMDTQALDELIEQLKALAMFLSNYPAIPDFPRYPSLNECIEEEHLTHYNRRWEPMPYVSWKFKGNAWSAISVNWLFAFRGNENGPLDWLRAISENRPGVPVSSAPFEAFGRDKENYDRARWKAGQFDMEVWNQVASELRYAVNDALISRLTTDVYDFFRYSPPYPRVQEPSGPEGINRWVPDIGLGEFVGNVFNADKDSRRGQLNKAFADIVATVAPSEVERLREAWKPFQRGKQFPWRGE